MKLPPPTHRPMPPERTAITHKFKIDNHKGYFTAGFYEDGVLGEVSIRIAKEGSTLSAFARAFGIAVSKLLQRGVLMSDLKESFSGMRFEPSGMTNRPDIPIAESIIDHLFQWLDTLVDSNGRRRT